MGRLANVERLTEAAADVGILLTLITDPAAAKKRLGQGAAVHRDGGW
jgi:hypothetical protein